MYVDDKKDDEPKEKEWKDMTSRERGHEVLQSHAR